MRIKCLAFAAALVVLAGLLRAEPMGWLGVYDQGLTRPMQIALGVEQGVLISDVAESSPAAKAGFKIGDVILRVDSQEIYTPEDLSHYVGRHPDKPVRIEYRREGRVDSLELKLGTRERQVEFSLDDIPQVTSAQAGDNPPISLREIRGLSLEIRALRDEIASLEKEIEKLRKDMKKLEK